MSESINPTTSNEANGAAKESRAVLPTICRFLRAKTGYGTLEGGENPWLLLDTSTVVYWCLQTTASYGPDDGLAHSDICRERRGCFVPPRQADPEE